MVEKNLEPTLSDSPKYVIKDLDAGVKTTLIKFIYD